MSIIDENEQRVDVSALDTERARVLLEEALPDPKDYAILLLTLAHKPQRYIAEAVGLSVRSVNTRISRIGRVIRELGRPEP